VNNGPHRQVLIFPDIDALSRAAAERFVSLSETAIRSRGRFATALSGGSTPRRLYSFLGSSPYSENINWKMVHLFWVDERCVSPSHEESNYKLVADELLFKSAIREENIHRIHGEEKPELAAERYEEELHRFFAPSRDTAFDLVVLGAGADGHTASLFGIGIAAGEDEGCCPVYRAKSGLTVPPLRSRFEQAAYILFWFRTTADIVYEVRNENWNSTPVGLVQPTDGDLCGLLTKRRLRRYDPDFRS
jgi:6-phosphogluconolactonase